MIKSGHQADQRFRKSDRLLKREAFRHTYEFGTKMHGRFFTAFVHKSDAGGPRIGLTVTRKVGMSVERNRCRRMLREAFRKQRALVVGLRGDIVINAKRQMVSAPYSEIESELVRLLTRIRP